VARSCMVKGDNWGLVALGRTAQTPKMTNVAKAKSSHFGIY